MKQLRFVAPIALLVLAGACNGDDSGTGDGDGDSNGDGGAGIDVTLTEDQQAAVEQLLAIGDEEGLVFDEGCVREQAAQLSDDDAAAIAEAGPEGDVELSTEGDAITAGLFDCIDDEAMVDRIIEEMQAAGADVDEECVRDALEGVTLSDLFAEGDGGAGSDSAAATAMLAALDCLGDLSDLEDLGG